MYLPIFSSQLQITNSTENKNVLINQQTIAIKGLQGDLRNLIFLQIMGNILFNRFSRKRP